MSDFAALLQRTANEIERPKPLPIGDYLLQVDSVDQITASTGTKGIRVNFIAIAADESVDKEALGDMVPGKKVNTRFWVTQDSVFMLADFLKHLGLGNKQMAEDLLEAPGKQVFATIKQRPGDNDMIWNDVGKFRPVG